MVDESLAWLLPGLLGLAVGSFLNVLIYRLPVMIEQSFESPADPASIPMNLAWPASHCPACRHPIDWHDNMPLLGFALLRGRCRHCHAAISWQYPLIELLTAGAFIWCWLRYPAWPAALAWAGFAAGLLALAVIDARTTWLPDALTQPMTWGGLIASAMGWTAIDLPSSLAGAVAGYLTLWTVYWIFRLITGKEGMGHGDFKLLAALGAWLGWQNLLAVLLIASVAGLLFALVQHLRGQLAANRQIPFGPFLAVAGAWLWLMGNPVFLKW